MPAIPQISDAEWEVMKAVWDIGPLTAGQVVDHLAGERQWKPRTVKTLLNRLVRKGAVAMETDGRRYVYSARVARDAVIKRETRSFLSRVFDGAAAPAIVHFIEQGRLTPDEVRQLRETLDRESKS